MKLISFLTLSISILFLSPNIIAQTSLEEIVNDMILPHEGLPHGVPSNYNWSQKPRAGAVEPPADWTAAIAWGQLYEWINGNPATNTRVQIKDLELYYLSKTDHSWHRLQKSLRVEGAAYVEDFVNDVNKPADKRLESDGSISVTCGDGYNFHFWPYSGRVTYPANDVAGSFVTVKARLIMDDPLGTDDRDLAKYVLSVGGDWWLSLTAQWDQWTTNADMGIGRFRFVTPEWKSFNMYSVPKDTIINNPPPFTSLSASVKDQISANSAGMKIEAFPNPCSDKTFVNYNLPQSGKATISIFDLQGKQIMAFSPESNKSGAYSVGIDASGIKQGCYFLRIEQNGYSKSSKLMVLN
ncbi:MAG: T9SS type A sorting domain-containing protein [Bacteroidales bacterium]|nr:T9SS type A sorting domain-containing protein [Bacteroidales bacterium]